MVGLGYPTMLKFDDFQDYFVTHDLPSPKPCWTSKKPDVTFESIECKPEAISEDDFINDLLNDANKLIELEKKSQIEMTTSMLTTKIITCAEK